VSTQLEALRHRLDARTASIGVAGLGYVGLPRAIESARAGFRVTGIDPDREPGDYERVVEHAFETRNAIRGARHGRARVVRL
jgi:UDP-N-acetyl-D-mannosaminuronate dehydrogenase